MRFIQRTWFVAVGNMPREKYDDEIQRMKDRVNAVELPNVIGQFVFDYFVPVHEGTTRLQVDELRFD